LQAAVGIRAFCGFPQMRHFHQAYLLPAMVIPTDFAEDPKKTVSLDPDNLKIIHASAYVGRKMVRYIPRAFGRTSPKMGPLVHIELVAKELT